jgi:two-component system, chemotaxis family, chemotaxis protein CheY
MSKTILIVDDARSMRGLVSMTLKGAGYEVIEACDGQDAMVQIAGKKIHMVITDLNMPNMNGIELIKALKADPAFKFLPMVMLTTESEETKKKRRANGRRQGLDRQTLQAGNRSERGSQNNWITGQTTGDG